MFDKCVFFKKTAFTSFFFVFLDKKESRDTVMYTFRNQFYLRNIGKIIDSEKMYKSFSIPILNIYVEALFNKLNRNSEVKDYQSNKKMN